MIEDVDDSLIALLRNEAGLDDEVAVSVATPDRAFADSLGTPAVDLWLHGIREVTDARGADWEDVRDANGRIQGRRAPLRRYRLAYLATAWATRAEDEHRLLSRLLVCLAGHDVIPGAHLAGSLAGQDRPVTVSVALPHPGDEAPWGLWAALGVAPRPALEVIVTAPLERPAGVEAGPPVRTRRVGVAHLPDGAPEVLRTEARDAVLRHRLERGAAAVTES